MGSKSLRNRHCTARHRYPIVHRHLHLIHAHQSISKWKFQFFFHGIWVISRKILRIPCPIENQQTNTLLTIDSARLLKPAIESRNADRVLSYLGLSELGKRMIHLMLDNCQALSSPFLIPGIWLAMISFKGYRIGISAYV